VSGGDLPQRARSSEPPSTVRVAVDLPGPQGERLYDYLPPEHGELGIGDAVVVPFGGRRAIGIVTSNVGALPPPPGVTLKRAEAKLSDGSLIGPLGMGLAESIATHWLAPLALTVRSLLPPGLLDKVEVAIRAVGTPSEAEEGAGIGAAWVAVDRLAGARGAGRSALLALIRSGEREGRLERSWRLSAVHGRLVEEPHAIRTSAAELPDARARLGLRQRDLLAALDRAAAEGDGLVRASDLPGGLPAARRLAALGLVHLEMRRRQRRHADRRDSVTSDLAVSLWSPSQSALLDSEQLERVTLIDGAPGSGKSRLAAEIAARTILAGRSVLWLVPEATQVALAADALRSITGIEPELVHSGASQGERLDAHARLGESGPHLVVGTRVALGALSREVGLIVVDEEHESAYKSDRTPRLHARDAAIMLGGLAAAPVLLISATPSIETLARVEQQGWRHVTLERRSAAIRVEVVDMRRELEEGWKSMISRPLLAALEALRWGEGEQALLIMNRRGLASALLCRDCGAAQSCPSCERPLVLHSAGSLLRCHGCGLVAEPLTRCPSCNGARIRAIGGGTERLEGEVKRLLPELRISRLDADTTASIGAGDRILDAFRKGETQLLIGTALAAKALDLPRLALVGIASADAGLLLPDERAAERVVSLIVQASGRLGRGGGGGTAWVQSYRPEDPAIAAAVELARGGDVSAWRRREALLRERAGGAPFLRTAKITISGASAVSTHTRAVAVADRLRAQLPEGSEARLLGPIPAWVPKRAGRWRENLILRSVDPLPLVQGLGGRDVSIDMDPETLL
jgi:primosomal protein N' (replication factor Y) (superfamily II helicase)